MATEILIEEKEIEITEELEKEFTDGRGED